MQKLSEDLEALKKLSSSLQQGYQEYCPDIRRQEAEVKNLQSRYANVSNQLNERWVTLMLKIESKLNLWLLCDNELKKNSLVGSVPT